MAAVATRVTKLVRALGESDCPECFPDGPPRVVATVDDDGPLPDPKALPRCPHCGGVAGFVQVIQEVVVGGREESEATSPRPTSSATSSASVTALASAAKRQNAPESR